MNFVVFADDWGVHPSSCQHIVRELLQDGHKVLWVNTVGMRQPKLNASDFRKGLRKLSKMITGRSPRQMVTAEPPGLTVVQPLMLPFPASKMAEKFNRWSMCRSVLSNIARLAFGRPIVVATVPNAAGVVTSIGAVATIYYCVDDFGQWPGLNSTVVQRMERDLISSSNALVAASSVIEQNLVCYGKPVMRIEHGVDLAHFASEATLPKRPTSNRSVGFFGLIDERLDDQLLADIARRLPDWQFILAGPSVVPLTDLRALENVKFLGNLRYDELPGFIAQVEVLILPYRISRFTNTLAPLKLKEYLASGCPVVTTPLAGTAWASDLLVTASTTDEWIAAITSADSTERRERQQRAAIRLEEDGWAFKAQALTKLASSLVKATVLPAG